MPFPYLGHLDFFSPYRTKPSSNGIMYSLTFPLKQCHLDIMYSICVLIQCMLTIYLDIFLLYKTMSFVRARSMSYLSVYPLCLNSVNAYKIKLNTVCFGVSVITVLSVALSIQTDSFLTSLLKELCLWL